MCYYDSNEKAIPLQLLESFLKQADTLFPVSLSAKLFPSTLSDYAKKLADKASALMRVMGMPTVCSNF